MHTGKARPHFRSQLFFPRRVKLIARVGSSNHAIPAALTPARGEVNMKRVASCKSKFRGTQPASLSGMIVIFFLAAATFAAPYLFAATDKKGSQAKLPQ